MTQNQSYAAFIGLDKSDKKINVSLQQCAKNKMERSIVKGGAEALHAWVAALCARFPGQAVAICLEQPASGLIHALMSYDFIVLFPINPMTLARYREAFTPSRAKDDPTDADFLCELVALHREQLKAWQPDDVCTRKLRHLTLSRRRSVNMRTRFSNQLKALLKTYFPQALELCGDDLTTPMACALLQKWPSLQQLKKSRAETIRRFYYAQNARRGDVIEKRLALIAQAVALTNDPALIESSIITVQALTLGLRAAHTAISCYDREIARTFAQHPDASLFAALPGSGTAYSARLLAAFGSRRELFESAEAMLNFSGVAPCSNAAAKRPSPIAVTRGRSLSTRASSSTPMNRSATASGPAPSTRCTRPPRKATGSSSAPWLTNGSVSSSAVGSSACLTTKSTTLSRYKRATPLCCHTLPNPLSKPLE